METLLTLGGPGCGKTSRLLDIVSEEMAAGVPPSRIAFVAFTTAAAAEAKGRAAEAYQLNAKKDLPWFRTIHSLAYGQVGVIKDEVMQPSDWADFSKVVGMNVTGKRWGDDVGKQGDEYAHVVGYGRTTQQTLQEAWANVGQGLNWFILERFASALAQFKKDRGKIDFTDMLLLFNKNCDPIDVDVAVIDEAQDLTPLQWEMVNHAFANVQRLYIAGDDDQAIYQWAGADVEKFLNLGAERVVLPKSHRMPRPIHEFTQGIAANISHRYQKHFSAASERDGELRWYQRYQQVDFETYPGSWLVLARNKYMLYDMERWIRRLGLIYQIHSAPSIKATHRSAIYGWQHWRKGESTDPKQTTAVLKMFDGGRLARRVNPNQEYHAADFGINAGPIVWHKALTGIPERDRWYYQACFRRKQSLKQEPRIRLDSIHGVKGAESDHVLLRTDMSAKTRRNFQLQPDTEHRVFYVGASRARESLHIVTPQSHNYYPL